MHDPNIQESSLKRTPGRAHTGTTTLSESHEQLNSVDYHCAAVIAIIVRWNLEEGWGQDFLDFIFGGIA